MCHKLTVLVLNHQESIIMLFDQISSIPGEIAIFIVSAIFPLVQVSVSIREHLVLTLRQALYRKGTFNRQMAVSGILEMLRNLKIHSMSGLAMSSSQYANSSSTGTSSTSILTQVFLLIISSRLNFCNCKMINHSSYCFIGDVRERYSSKRTYLKI